MMHYGLKVTFQFKKRKRAVEIKIWLVTNSESDNVWDGDHDRRRVETLRPCARTIYFGLMTR